MSKKTPAVLAVVALVLVSGTARVGAQGQAEQFTPEFREVRRTYDEKHTPKIEAPDQVKRGQWFEVTVTVGAGGIHPSLAEHFVRYIALYKDSAETPSASCTPVFPNPKAVFTTASAEAGRRRPMASPRIRRAGRARRRSPSRARSQGEESGADPDRRRQSGQRPNP